MLLSLWPIAEKYWFHDEARASGRPDGDLIRRAAIDAHVPLITVQLVRAVVDALRIASKRKKTLRAWDEFVRARQGGGGRLKP